MCSGDSATLVWKSTREGSGGIDRIWAEGCVACRSHTKPLSALVKGPSRQNTLIWEHDSGRLPLKGNHLPRVVRWSVILDLSTVQLGRYYQKLHNTTGILEKFMPFSLPSNGSRPSRKATNGDSMGRGPTTERSVDR